MLQTPVDVHVIEKGRHCGSGAQRLDGGINHVARHLKQRG